MSGHLCLKWNNHSSAFLKSIINIHSKEKYCDATIVCQGKYFPVHRVVLSTCSDYFDEMFERMQCPNPYIVFRDIEPKEMELLLNYMYQGEVNVIQESLPTLIKAAEALKIKGLAVPDDLPSSKEPSGRKRSSTSNDTPLSKRRAEERRKRRDSPHRNSESDSYSQISSDRNNLLSDPPPLESIQKIIKEEPLDTSDYVDSNVPNSSHSSVDSHSINKEENLGTFEEFPVTHIKTEDGSLQGEDGLYEGQQSSAWSEYPTSNIDDLPPPDDLGGQDDDDSDSFWSSHDFPHSSSSAKSRQSNSLKTISIFKPKYLPNSKQRVSKVCKIENCGVEIFAACPKCSNLLCYNHFNSLPCGYCKGKGLISIEGIESTKALTHTKFNNGSEEWNSLFANCRDIGFSFASDGENSGPIQRIPGAVCGNTCRRQCKTITEEKRNNLLETFWTLEDSTARFDYLSQHVEISSIKQRTIKEDRQSRRSRTLRYFFTLNTNSRIEVCKVFFLGTLQVTERQIRSALGLVKFGKINSNQEEFHIH